MTQQFGIMFEEDLDELIAQTFSDGEHTQSHANENCASLYNVNRQFCEIFHSSQLCDAE